MSITQPGEAPAPASLSGSAIHVLRRSLDTRNSERMAEAAVTPHAFVEGVGRAMQGHIDPLRFSAALPPDEFVSSEAGDREGHSSRRSAGVPRSYGPGSGPSLEEV